jgi:hypothetical protein
LFLLFWSGFAFAQARAEIKEIVPIKLVVVHRTDITDQQQIDLFYEAMRRLPEVKASAKVIAIISTEDEVQENDFDQYVHRMFSWWDWAKRKKYNERGVIVFFLLPPVERAGILYGGGAAGATCVRRRNTKRQFAYSIMRLKNVAGEDRIENSIVSALHEMLHTLGANHFDSRPNVMRSYFTPGTQPIVKQTKREVEYCRQGKSPKGN